MGYRLSLDEYRTETLLEELQRRQEAHAKGLCDYCFRPWNTSTCKFLERHTGRENATQLKG